MELLLEAERFAARTGRRWVMEVVGGSGDLQANAGVHGPPTGRNRVMVEREDHVEVHGAEDDAADGRGDGTVWFVLDVGPA